MCCRSLRGQQPALHGTSRRYGSPGITLERSGPGGCTLRRGQQRAAHVGRGQGSHQFHREKSLVLVVMVYGCLGRVRLRVCAWRLGAPSAGASPVRQEFTWRGARVIDEPTRFGVDGAVCRSRSAASIVGACSACLPPYWPRWMGKPEGLLGHVSGPAIMCRLRACRDTKRLQ